MKNTRFENALPALQTVRLTDQEKHTIRQNLLAHMHAGATLRVWSAWEHFRRTAFILRPLGAFAMAFFLIALSAGAAVFAAGSSLPGDMLYPVKTRMNEPVIALFKTTAAEKVAFEWELLDRRLTEAEQLAENALRDQKERIRALIIKQQTRAEGLSRRHIEQEFAKVAVHVAPPSAVRTVREAVLSSDKPASAPKEAQSGRTGPARTSPSPGEDGASISALAAMQEEALSTTTADTASKIPVVEVSGVAEKLERIEVGKRVFIELNAIFERHRGIVRKLDLPLPYVEATEPHASGATGEAR